MKIVSLFASHAPSDLRANLNYRAKLHRYVIEHPKAADILWDTCARDPIFYVNTFCYTYDPRLEPFAKVPFLLYPFQVNALLTIVNSIGKNDLFILKSRDMGISWLCVIAYEWFWHFYPLKSFLMISRIKDYVDKSDNPKSLFWKIDFLHDNFPLWLMPKGYNRSEHRASLHIFNPENGSVIDGESTTEQAARGDRRTSILLDEFAAVEQGHRVLAATRDATNSRIFNSTPQGIGNAHYDISQTSIQKLRLHWSEHPLKNVGLYTTGENGTLKILDEAGFSEKYKPILDGKLRSMAYDLQESRCSSLREMAQEWDIDFLGSGHQYFLGSAVEDAIRRFSRPPVLVGDLEYDTATAEPSGFKESESGRLRLWTLLDKNGNISKDYKYVLGVDVSAGTGSSNSVICGYDIVTNEKIIEYANPHIRPEEFAKQTVAIARWLGKAYLIWESNGPGRQFGSRVGELHYGNVYLRRKEERLDNQITIIPGWASTRETKAVLLGAYREAIEKGSCVNRSKEALEECYEYIFDATGNVVHSKENVRTDPSGARSNHGDRVMADALAWRGLSERRSKPEPIKREIPIGSLAWRMEERKRGKAKPGRELLKSKGWG